MTFGLPMRWGLQAGRFTTRCLRSMTGAAHDWSPAAAATGTIVLEAEVGGIASAVFVVANHLEEPISTPVELRGSTDGLALRIDPAFVTLEPDEQALVRVVARIDETLADGAGYRGAVAVRGVPGAELPILVRQGEGGRR